MNKWFLITIVLLLPTACSRPKGDAPVGADGWLRGDIEAKFATVSKHLRGNDVVMWEVAHRHQLLLAAIEAQNWRYAGYQLEKMELTMQLGAERRSFRRASYQEFFRTAMPTMKEALANQEPAESRKAYQRLTLACAICHENEGVAFIPVTSLHP